MKVYKLTSASGMTHQDYKWSLPKDGKPGEWHRANGEGTELCSDGYLHWYHHPMLAPLLDPIHACIGPTARLWEAETRGEILDDNGLKGGSKGLRLIREIELPAFSTEQQMAFGIYCALEVCNNAAFAKWANAWLDGSDRSAAAAWAAANAAWAARDAEAAARAAAWAGAAWAAAGTAAWAAEAAAWAAARAAAEAAARAARAAAWAAGWDAVIRKELLVRCAEKAYNFKP